METIFDKLVQHVTEGGRYNVDLVNKTLRLGKKVVIDEGRYEGELIGDLPYSPWEMADVLFWNYYNSVPSAWTNKGSRYFKARDAKDMDVFELNGEPRMVAQAKLEGYILCAVLAGLLRWNDLYGSWFWRSPRYDDFRLLKVWF